MDTWYGWLEKPISPAMEPATRGPGTSGLTDSLRRAVLGLVLASAAVNPLPGADGNDAPPQLGPWERVRVKMDARGELFAPTGDDSGEVRRAFTAAARLDFLEGIADATPAGDTAAAPPHAARGVRHFFSAASELTIDGVGTRRSLEPATTTLIVASSPTVTHFAPDALLTREQAELLAIAFDPLLLDGLLPPTDAGPAEWRPSAELVAALLAIDTVGRPVGEPETESADDPPDSATGGPLLARLEPAADPDGARKLTVSGTVHGAVDGVPTTIRVDGSYELDAAGRRVKSGIVRLREKRQAGHVSPGFECEASFQMARRPAAGSQAVPTIDAAVPTGMEAAWTRLYGGEFREARVCCVSRILIDASPSSTTPAGGPSPTILAASCSDWWTRGLSSRSARCRRCPRAKRACRSRTSAGISSDRSGGGWGGSPPPKSSPPRSHPYGCCGSCRRARPTGRRSNGGTISSRSGSPRPGEGAERP